MRNEPKPPPSRGHALASPRRVFEFIIIIVILVKGIILIPSSVIIEKDPIRRPHQIS